MSVAFRVKRSASGQLGFGVTSVSHGSKPNLAPLPAIDYFPAYFLRAHGLPAPQREVVLIPDRKFRWDYVWDRSTGKGVCVDVQGGTFVNGGHVRPLQYEADCEKLALTQLAGWTCLFMTPRQIKTGQGLRWIKEALNSHAPYPDPCIDRGRRPSVG